MKVPLQIALSAAPLAAFAGSLSQPDDLFYRKADAIYSKPTRYPALRREQVLPWKAKRNDALSRTIEDTLNALTGTAPGSKPVFGRAGDPSFRILSKPVPRPSALEWQYPYTLDTAGNQKQASAHQWTRTTKVPPSRDWRRSTGSSPVIKPKTMRSSTIRSLPQYASRDSRGRFISNTPGPQRAHFN